MAFLDVLNDDLQNSFFDVKTFGESVTLQRGGSSYSMRGLFDTPELANDSIGVDVEGITHTMRLFVRASDLPGNKPRKNDVFVISSNQFHSSFKCVALDYVFEKDGVVVYRLKETR